jgi:hypothetical protein
MTDQQILDVVRAHQEGKQIQQSRLEYNNGEWIDCHYGPGWNFANFSYRVKPEPKIPREFWIHDYSDGTLEVSRSAGCSKCIHVREVLEEQ